jgi:hypothetical protein
MSSLFISSLFFGAIRVFVLLYVVGIGCYAANHFIIVYKEQMWKDAPEQQVIEEIKYLLRKHGDCSDLETMEAIINESKQLTKYNEAYRNDCYNNGLKYRVKMLETV